MDRLQKIKYRRMKPEEQFLYRILTDLKKEKSEILGSTIYKNDDEEILDYDPNNNYLWCNYFRIWMVLKQYHKLSDIECKDVIYKMVKSVLHFSELEKEWIC